MGLILDCQKKNRQPRANLSRGCCGVRIECDALTQRLRSVVTTELEHYAAMMPVKDLLAFCINKANEGKGLHARATKLEERVLDTIIENYPFFLALKTKLPNPGRRKRKTGIPSWGEFINQYFAWCSRRTVYRAFVKLEQRLNILRGVASPLAERRTSRYMPSQHEVKVLVEAAPIGTELAQILHSDNPNFEQARRLADEYLRLAPSTTLKQEFFPESIRSCDGFCPENYNQTFPFYPPLAIHPTMGAFGCFFCRPETNFTGLLWGVYPRSFLRRVLTLFPMVKNVLHCPSGTLENLPPGHVTVDLVRDEFRRPMVIGDAHHMPFAAASFDLILCDRPYTPLDAEIYGTPMVNMNKFMREAWRVLRPGGFLGILDLITFPVCPRSRWRLRGVIGVVPWSNQRFRSFSILQTPAVAKAAGEGSEDVGEPEIIEDDTRSFAILQKISRN